MRYHPFAGISPARPSARTPFRNLSATQMLGCTWHGKGPAASRRGTARAVPAASPCQIATLHDATELTEPTDPRPVMKRLSCTTVRCGTSPPSRLCGQGSRPGSGSRATGSRTRDGSRRNAAAGAGSLPLQSLPHCATGTPLSWAGGAHRSAPRSHALSPRPSGSAVAHPGSARRSSSSCLISSTSVVRCSMRISALMLER